MKPEFSIPKNITWVADILHSAQTFKQQPKDFFYASIKKIISKSLNPQTKGMMGCFSAEMINKITTQISKSLSVFLLSEFNSVIHTEAKTMKELFQSLNYSFGNKIKSYSKKLFKSEEKAVCKSRSIQTEPQILSITPVVSVGIQTVKTNNKSVVISNNFKVKTEPIQENFLTERECELQSVINKQPRLFTHTKKSSELFSKSYQMKKWSIDNLHVSRDSTVQKKVLAASYYPSNKPSRAKFYYQKLHQRKSSIREKDTFYTTQ